MSEAAGAFPPLLPPAFYRRPAVELSQALLGKQLVRGEVVLRITEVEAYGGQEDTASHCRFGLTPRNAPMWEEGGRAYIYLCYGLHRMLNIVAGARGEGGAVLIRACAPVAGLDAIRVRRGFQEGPALLTGPGKVAQALDLDLTFNHQPLYEPGGLELRDGPSPAGLLGGPRVGVDYADPVHRLAFLRFAEAGSVWVSHRKGLAPWLQGCSEASPGVK